MAVLSGLRRSLVACLLAALAPWCTAYERYSDGCDSCHGGFMSTTSTKPGNTWPDKKHDVHRHQMLNDECLACHVSVGDNPQMNRSGGTASLPADGCLGCHGQPTAGGGVSGAGLRRFHANKGVAVDCADCHTSDPVPPAESVAPPYYGKTGVNITAPCNGDGSEDWTGDGLGLDNDGNLVYDTADVACKTCAYAIDPLGAPFPGVGGTGTVTVIVDAGCTWVAGSNAPWITITSGAGGSGDGTVSYTVASTNQAAQRVGTLTVAGALFTVTQAGASCLVTVSAGVSPAASGTVVGAGAVVCGTDAVLRATPATGYHFVRWTQEGGWASPDNPLTLSTAAPPPGGGGAFVLTAEFALNTYTVTFLAGAGGTLTGIANQQITHGGDATPVTAVPDPGFAFVRWSDNATANPRTLTRVTSSTTLTAQFVAIGPVAPDGTFTFAFIDPANPGPRELWDLTGHYEVALATYLLVMNVTHDEKGTLGGAGTLSGTLPGGTPVSIPLVAKGKATGKTGVVSLKLGLAGRTPTSSAKVALVLTLDAGALVGTFSLSTSDAAGGKDQQAGACNLALPPGLSGGYVLVLTLSRSPAGSVTGSGDLVLQNGRTVRLTAKGSGSATGSALQVAGDKAANPLFSAVKLTLSLLSYSDGTGEIRGVGGKAFGQALRWP